MLIETSQDILYLVISFCVLWATVFLCWVFYYLAHLLKNANQIVEEFRVRLQALADAIDYVRGKVEQMSDLLTLARSGVSGLVKKVACRKAEDWLDDSSAEINKTAKAAVDKAVAVAAAKMKKAARDLKK